MKRLTTKEFIERAINIHGQFYDYSSVVYTISHNKVKILCPKHGEVWQKPNAHLNGNGCHQCGRELVSKKLRRTKKQFINQATKIHGDYFDYTMVEYINDYLLVLIICPKHGEFTRSPSEHIFLRYGCPSCRMKKASYQNIWLDEIGLPDDNDHREVTIHLEDRFIQADGYCSETNTVYEFLGDYWHGNPNKYPSNIIHPHMKSIGKTYGDLYEEVIAKLQKIQDTGYNLEYIWELDFLSNRS